MARDSDSGFPKWKPKNCPKKVSKMETQKLSKKKVVPKMEAQKLSKKKFPKWKPKNFPKKVVPKMDGQKLSKKVVPKMEAQKLSKKKFQNGNPKTFQKNVVPKMETQKLSKKKWFPKWKAKNFPKKWFPKWFPFIRHWLGSWALGFYLEDTFGMCFLGPGILSLTCSFWSHFGISQALGF